MDITQYQHIHEMAHLPRENNEIDLVGYVYSELQNNGLVINAKYFLNAATKLDITDKKPEVQRYYLNSFFFSQLLMANEPSYEERFCLVPDGDATAWAKLFSKKILNFLIRNNLPREIM